MTFEVQFLPPPTLEETKPVLKKLVSAHRYTLTQDGFLVKQKIWRTNYHVNLPLFNLLKGESQPIDPAPPIISVHPSGIKSHEK